MNKEKITEALRKVCRKVYDNSHSAPDWYERQQEAEHILRTIDDVYPFNEYIREHDDPDNELNDMGYLEEMCACGGDWGNPMFVLQRAFYGYRYSRFAKDGREREPFNPNDEYFTFNGYGNLVSVSDYDWGHYWASILDEDGYIEAAKKEGHLDEIAEALGIEDEGE